MVRIVLISDVCLTFGWGLICACGMLRIDPWRLPDDDDGDDDDDDDDYDGDDVYVCSVALSAQVAVSARPFGTSM